LRASLLNWCTTYPPSMSFQETTSGDGIFLNTWRFCYSDVVDQKLLLGTCTITTKNLGNCYCLWWNITKSASATLLLEPTVLSWSTFSLGNLLNQFEDGFWKLIKLPSYGPLHSNQLELSMENHTKD
jgi:hypothetical protein